MRAGLVSARGRQEGRRRHGWRGREAHLGGTLRERYSFDDRSGGLVSAVFPTVFSRASFAFGLVLRPN